MNTMNNQRIASELLQVARLLTAVIPSGDCFKFATKEAKRNDLAEERDIDLSKVKFKVRSSSDMVAVEMLYGGKRIGGMNAHNVRYPEEQACPTDVTALAKRFPELIKGEWERSDGEVWRSITALAVFKAFITTEEFRGLGLGKRMYKTLMRAWFKKVGPFLFMPYKCDGGSGTSTDAMRVWHSLSKEFPSSGDVVAVMKNPHVARELTASASGFMSEYRSSTYDNPLDPSVRVWSFGDSNTGERLPLIVTEMVDGRKLYLGDDDAEAIWFKSIASPEKQGTGMASVVLKKIIKMADKHNVTLFGTAKPFGTMENKLNKSQLMSWYKRHGWVKDSRGGIVRKPNQ